MAFTGRSLRVDQGRPPEGPVCRRPGSGYADGRRGRRPLSGLFQAPRDRGDSEPAGRRGPAAASGRAPGRHVRWPSHQHHRGPGRPPRRPAHAGDRPPRGRRPGRRGRRARGAGPDGRPVRSDPERGVDGLHRPPDPVGGQHRDRRVRSRPGHGLRGATRLCPPGHHVSVRLQHRPRRPVEQDPRPRPGRDALRGVLQDLHHPGDPDQCGGGPGLAARRAGSGGRRGGKALRRRVDQRGGGHRVRHRPGQHAGLLGLGRRTVLLRLGRRVLVDGGHRARGLR